MSEKQNLAKEVAVLWLINLRISKSLQNKYVTLLAPDELDRAERFRFEKDRRNYVAARACLRKILSGYLDIEPRQIQFSYGDVGKPYLLNRRDLQFNLSHSGDFALIGVAIDHEIGVDIELIRHQEDLMDVARHNFSETEYQGLIELSEDHKLRAFYRCWTRKEAIIKLLGTGLQLPLSSFAVTLDNDTNFELINCDWEHHRHENWRFFPVSLEGPYVAAMVVEGPIGSYQIKRWEHRES